MESPGASMIVQVENMAVCSDIVLHPAVMRRANLSDNIITYRTLRQIISGYVLTVVLMLQNLFPKMLLE
jgi:hypothetical protein